MTILCPALSQGGFTVLSSGLGLVLAWQRGRHAENSQLAQPHGDHFRVDQVNENPRHDGPPKGHYRSAPLVVDSELALRSRLKM